MALSLFCYCLAHGIVTCRSVSVMYIYMHAFLAVSGVCLAHVIVICRSVSVMYFYMHALAVSGVFLAMHSYIT